MLIQLLPKQAINKSGLAQLIDFPNWIFSITQPLKQVNKAAIRRLSALAVTNNEIHKVFDMGSFARTLRAKHLADMTLHNDRK